MNKDSFCEYIIQIIRPMVVFPDQVKCEHSTDDMGTLFKVITAKEDMGRVIGKEGKTIDAIRHLLKISAFNHSIRGNLKIIDSN